jgi:hypothetical protein
MILCWIGHGFARRLSIGGDRSETRIAMCHVGMIKELSGILFLRKKQNLRIACDRYAKKLL